MTEPVLLRFSRPYSSVEEFLDAEAHLIDARGMLLVGAAPLAEGTVLRFVITLASGEAIIKAEARARVHEPASGASPGGLRIAFKRYGTSTKELIDRAVAQRRRRSPDDDEIDSSPRPTFVLGELSSPIATEIMSSPAAAAAPEGPAASPPVEPGATAPIPAETYSDQSGVRYRQIDLAALETPQNRDELLDRLRRRASEMSADLLRSLTKRTG